MRQVANADHGDPRKWLAALHPDVAATCALKEIRRELTLPTGGVHFVALDFDRLIEKIVEAHYERYLGHSLRNAVIGRDELCQCANHGRLLLCALHQARASVVAAPAGAGSQAATA